MAYTIMKTGLALSFAGPAMGIAEIPVPIFRREIRRDKENKSTTGAIDTDEEVHAQLLDIRAAGSIAQAGMHTPQLAPAMQIAAGGGTVIHRESGFVASSPNVSSVFVRNAKEATRATRKEAHDDALTAKGSEPAAAELEDGNLTVQLMEVPIPVSAHLHKPNTSTQRLHETISITHEITNASSIVTSERSGLANALRKKLPRASSGFAQIHDELLTMAVIPKTEGFSTFFMVLVLIVLLVLALYGLTVWHRRMTNQRLCRQAMEDLRIAADHAVRHALMHNDWHHALNKLRELREDKVNKNHPIYTTIERYMHAPGTQAELQNLFSELREGEQFLTAEKLKSMFTNLHVQVHSLATGQVFDGVQPRNLVWLTNSIEQPLTYPLFLSMYALLFVVWGQTTIISSRGDGSTQAAKGHDVEGAKVSFHMEIRDGIVYRGSFLYGNFARLSDRVFVDHDVNVETFARLQTPE